MSDFLKLSEASSLALHTMAILAKYPEMQSTRKIAETLNASPHHLAKIMQRLVKLKMVESVRGPRGGFKLVKSAKEINLLEIYEAIEGPFELPECAVCTGSCMLYRMFNKMKNDFINMMTETDLDSFARAFNRPLAAL